MTLNQTQAAKAKSIFIRFSTRESLLTTEQAKEELRRLMVGNRLIPEKNYLQATRSGASFTTNRAKRIAIYATMTNAVNHATFAD